MADQDDAAPVIVVGEVFAPGSLDVLIGQVPVGVSYRLAHQHGRQRGQGDLTIHGRVEAALGAEAGELAQHYVGLRRLDRHGRVGARVGGNGGIDVEAVDRRVRIGVEALNGRRPVGLDDRRVEVDSAGVVAPRPAKPGAGIGVVVRGRGGRGRGRRRCGGGRLRVCGEAKAAGHSRDQRERRQSAFEHDLPQTNLLF